MAENYIDAIKYLRLSFCTDCNALIFSYLQLGDIENAKPLLEQRKTQPGAGSYRTAGGIDAVDLALLDSDLSKAMRYLKLEMDNSLILSGMHRYLDPLYSSLREHSEWPALLAESEKRATGQREIFLRLVAEDGEINQ